MATGQFNSFPINWEDINSSSIPYTNTTSGLSADDVQDAVDELASEKQNNLTAGIGITISSDVIAVDTDETLTQSGEPADAKVTGDKLDHKAEIDGYYEELTSGSSEQLMSKKGLTDITPYTYRAIPHDSTREVMRKLVGATVGWNQLVQNGNFASVTGWGSLLGIATASNNELTYTVGTIGNNYFNNQVLQNGFNVPTNHVILLHAETFTPYTNGFYMSVRTNNIGQSGTGISNVTPTANAWSSFSKVTKTINILTDIAFYWSMNTLYQVGDSVKLRNVFIIDLTAMLGATIADYVYSLETATVGAGVAWCKDHFPKAFNEYQPYDAGSLKSVEGLVSHDTVGFNQWNEEWENGTYNGSTGAKQASTAAIRNANPISIISGKSYYLNFGGNLGSAALVFLYDHGMNYLGNASISASRAITFSTGVAYINFRVVVTTYNHDICINLSDPQRNGQYEPYQKHSYPLDPTQELRGIFKLDSANKLYADGDEWHADGRKNTRYGIVDLGTLNWTYVSASAWNCFSVSITGKATGNNFICSQYANEALYNTENDKCIAGNANNATVYIRDTSFNNDAAAFKTAMSGVMLVYELATPTESTAPSFADVQIIDPDGTEEFVTDCIVAVGTETFYADDLVGKLDDLPALPTTAGDFRLKVTIVGGVPTYSWSST